MNIQKITRLSCISLGVLGLISLAVVFVSGDDSIKMSAASGDFSLITPIILISQLVIVGLLQYL